jgi:hypothetical protein
MSNHRGYFSHCLQRASLIAPVLLAACCPSSRFSGDGNIASETCWPFSNYSVEFAPLSTGTAESRKYLIRALPDLDSVVGLRVTTPRPLYCEEFKRASAAKAVVALRLVSGTGQEVVQHRAALSDWIWSYGGPPNPPRPWEPDECFLYSRSLYFDPGSLRDLTLQITVEQQAESPVDLTPTVKSYAAYAP